MYQWKRPFIWRLVFFFVTAAGTACGLLFLPEYIAMIRTHGISIIMTEVGCKFTVAEAMCILAMIWLLPAIARLLDWRVDVLINERGIQEKLSSMAIKQHLISWEEIEHIHIYPMPFLPKERVWKKRDRINPVNVVIVLRDGCALQKTYSWWMQINSRSAPKVHRHVSHVDSCRIIKLPFDKFGLNGLDVVRAMRKHANVSTHGKYRDG